MSTILIGLVIIITAIAGAVFKFFYWWGGAVSESGDIQVDRDNFFALSGARKGIRVVGGVLVLLAGLVLFLMGQLLAAAGALFVGVLALASGSMVAGANHSNLPNEPESFV